jgi:hypothetical protein
VARGGAERPDAIIETDPVTLAGVLWHGRSLAQTVRRGAMRLDGDRAAAESFLRLFPLPERTGEESAALGGHQR